MLSAPSGKPVFELFDARVAEREPSVLLPEEVKAADEVPGSIDAESHQDFHADSRDDAPHAAGSLDT